jgi:lipopolysaccharide export system permease protein
MNRKAAAKVLFRSRFSSLAFFHISREYILSFLISFLFFFVIFFINQILLLAEDILSKNAPLTQTMLLLLYSLPSVIAIAFPFAALAGALMAVAGLNADREILAFSAAGISPAALYAPFILLGICATLLSFAANDYLLPRGSVAFRSLYGELVARSASIELSPYSVKRYSKAIVVTGGKKEDAIADVMLFDLQEGQKSKVITAGMARLSIDEYGEFAVIEMRDILEHKISKAKQSFSITRADSLEYRFALKEPVVGFSGTSPSEMPSRALYANIQKKKAALAIRKDDMERQYSSSIAKLLASYGSFGDARAGSENLRNLRRTSTAVQQAMTMKPTDRTLQIFQLEYNKKFAIPAAGFFFSLLAFPLGLGANKAGRTAGFGMALLLSTMYWGMLFIGQSIGLKNILSPGLAMWLPNIFVSLMAVIAWIVRSQGSRRAI